MSDTVWQSAHSAPRADDNYSYSRTFVAVYADNPTEPFPCKTRNGHFYDLDDCDADCGWVRVDPTGLLWAEMPKPTLAVLTEAKAIVITAIQTFRAIKGEADKLPVVMEFTSLDEAADTISALLKKTGHQFHAESRDHILDLTINSGVNISHEDYRIEIRVVSAS